MFSTYIIYNIPWPQTILITISYARNYYLVTDQTKCHHRSMVKAVRVPDQRQIYIEVSLWPHWLVISWCLEKASEDPTH